MTLRLLLSACLLWACGDSASSSVGGQAPVGGQPATTGGGDGAGGSGGGSGGAISALCGNGVREGDEPCDQDDFDDTSCADFGMTGQIGCTPACDLDPTACFGCGNGFLDPGEVCDGDLVADGCLAGADPDWIASVIAQGIEEHAVIDLVRGAPTCNSECQLDFSTCGYCVDGVISSAESCEISSIEPPSSFDLDGATCESLGYGPGILGCSVCGFNVEDCGAPPPPPCLGGNCSLRFHSSWSPGGICNCVELPAHLAFASTGALTVEYWMRYQGVLFPGAYGFGVLSTEYVPGFRLGAFTTTPDTTAWQGYWGTINFGTTVPGVSGATWRHLAGVVDPISATSRLYVDGQLAAESAVTPWETPLPFVEPWIRVGWPYADDYEPGMVFDVDEIRISSSARYSADFTPQAVLGVDADTLALWHLDDNSPVVTDSGPYGLHGFIGEDHGGDWSGDHP